MTLFGLEQFAIAHDHFLNVAGVMDGLTMLTGVGTSFLTFSTEKKNEIF